MGARLRAVARLALYLGWTGLLLPVQIAAVALDRPLARRLPRFYHRRCLRIFGIRALVRGEPAGPAPTLFIANHSSYLDIVVLSALIEGSFVAKREVSGWPLLGLLAKLQRTVFIERAARRDVHAQRDEMQRRIRAGDNLILFPEGTSDDGVHVLPFKSALFSAAGVELGDGGLRVQPVSIAYTRLDGLPLGRALLPFVAWYGDMALLPHLLRLTGLGRLTVEVTFHAPVTLHDFSSRKALSDHCRAVIAKGVGEAAAGRARPLADPGGAERPAAARISA